MGKTKKEKNVISMLSGFTGDISTVDGSSVLSRSLQTNLGRFKNPVYKPKTLNKATCKDTD